MDISTLTDIKELKSMAYDQMAAFETAQKNLSTINQRIEQLGSTPPTVPPEEPTSSDEDVTADPEA